MTESSASIYYRDVSHFVTQGVLHELLHIHRYWIEGIPQMVPLDKTDGNKWRVTSSIENALEHVVIVPREKEYGFEPFEYWNKTARKNWGRYPWPELADGWVRRKNCLLHYLSIRHLVTDDRVRTMAENALRAERMLTEAEAFADRIGKALGSKPRAISIAAKSLGIPRGDARLELYDVKRHRRLVNKIPRY